MLHVTIEKRTLLYRKLATTSRGTYTQREIRLVHVTDSQRPGIEGVGECSPLPDLSADALPGTYDLNLLAVCNDLCQSGSLCTDDLRSLPSILFGLETALWQLQRGGSQALSSTPFARAEVGIPINGLVWMADLPQMMEEMERKVKAGFHCIKLKIGGLDFDRELLMVRTLRSHYPNIQIRLDANGAFDPHDALSKLDALSHFDIHSIEQPIRAKQWNQMAHICKSSPIPIALDEELIGVATPDQKALMLSTIQPQYIVLKPTLHGGISGTREWVSLANNMGIGSWLTSALESNVGLNAIAHLAAELYGPNPDLPQGLGTGQLFTENIPMPLVLRGEHMFFQLQD